ncbi:hypothetical protein BDV10DRAFT_140253 [Aspergillus recurvatus]
MSVRKAHNSGRNHLRNVVEYYQQIGQEKAQSVIDSITSSYAAEGQAVPNPAMVPPGAYPPPFGFPGAYFLPPRDMRANLYQANFLLLRSESLLLVQGALPCHHPPEHEASPFPRPSPHPPAPWEHLQEQAPPVSRFHLSPICLTCPRTWLLPPAPHLQPANSLLRQAAFPFPLQTSRVDSLLFLARLGKALQDSVPVLVRGLLGLLAADLHQMGQEGLRRPLVWALGASRDRRRVWEISDDSSGTFM